MTTIFLSANLAHELNSALVARPYFIEAAFEEMDRNYGGPVGFLKKAIGLTEEDLNKLKNLYTVEKK